MNVSFIITNNKWPFITFVQINYKVEIKGGIVLLFRMYWDIWMLINADTTYFYVLNIYCLS
jgi:hypothetical protein